MADIAQRVVESAQQPLRLAAACAWLAAAASACLLPLAAWGWWQFAWVGVVVAVGAVAVSGVGAGGALLITYLTRGSRHVVGGLLGAMAWRMSLPLVGLLVMSRSGGVLAESSVVLMVLASYLVLLAVETPLAIRVAALPRDGAAPSSVLPAK